jgi:hypothetical protein
MMNSCGQNTKHQIQGPATLAGANRAIHAHSFAFVVSVAVIVSMFGLSSCAGYTSAGSPGQSGSGVLSPNPTTIGFGSVSVGSSKTMGLTVTNSGVSSVNISKTVVSGTGLSIVGGSPSSIAAGQSSTIQIQFTPTTMGTVPGNLAIFSDASNSTLSVDVMGTGAQPGLTLTPSFVNFGNVTVGQSASQSVTLTNSGTVSVTLSAATPSGSPFSMSGLSIPATLAAAQSISFSVKFAPTAAGVANGGINITDSAPGSPQTVVLAGTGIAVGTPAISVTPASTPFGTVTIGGSGTQSIKISNTGNATLTITAANMGGSSEFSKSGLTLPLTIAAGGSSSFSAKFAPTASGSVSGSISLVSNAPTSPTVASFSGTGAPASAPTISLTPTSLTFGSVTVGGNGTQSVTISNKGNAALTVTAANMAGSAEFTKSGPTLPLTVAAGGSSNFSVKFAPTASGSVSGSVSLVSNAPTSPSVVSFSGSGANPGPAISLNTTNVSFGNVASGNSGSQVVTISNTGGANLTVTAANMSGSSEFSTSGLTLPLTVAAGNNSSFTLKFVPTASGSVNGSVSLVSNAPTSPTMINFSGSSGTVSGGPTMPTLPQSIPNTGYPTLTGTTWNVPAGNAAALQNDINSAACGDTIILPAGTSYNGNFIFSHNCSGSLTSGTGWIILRTSTLDASLPQGIRVTPSQASLMAQISTSNGSPAFAVLPNTSGLRVIGVEFTSSVNSPSTPVFNIVLTGYQADNATQVSVVSQIPANVIFDRILCHGAPYGSTNYSLTFRHGLSMNIAGGALIDSDLRNFWQSGTDASATGATNAPGPLLIQNNYLSSATEVVIFGGSDPGVTNLVPADITIVGNEFTRPTGYFGQGIDVKNLLELKNAQRVLVDSNLFEYNWADGQQGVAIVFTPRNQNHGCPLCTVADVTFSNNIVRHVTGGLEISGADTQYTTSTSQPSQRVRIYNNVFEDVGYDPGTGGNKWIFEIVSSSGYASPHDIIIDHNTSVANAGVSLVLNLGMGGGAPLNNWQWTNNILSGGANAMNSSDPTIVQSQVGGSTSWQDDLYIIPSGYGCSVFPGNAQCPTMPSLGYNNPIVGPGEDYTMAPASPYFTAATDGTAIGVDWSAINALLATMP